MSAQGSTPTGAASSSSGRPDGSASRFAQAGGEIASPASRSHVRTSSTSSTASASNLTPTRSGSVDTAPGSGGADGVKSKLLSQIDQKQLAEFVENRPDREQLIKKNIIKSYDHNTDPKLQGVMSSLIKTQTEDRLAQSLNKRRTVQELVAQGIMMDQSKGTISVQLAQRALLRQMERDRLSAFLTKRPTLDELVKTKSNIMEDTMTWIRCAALTGSIPLPRNCHTMNSFPNSTKLYLLGGYGTGSTTNSDLLILDTQTDTWVRPPVGGSIPCERYSHTCSSLGNGKLVVFGGFSTNGVWLNDVYVLDTQVVQAFYTKSPPPPNTASSQSGSQHQSPLQPPQPSPSVKSPTLSASSPNQRPSPSMLSSASPPFQPQQQQQSSSSLQQSPSQLTSSHNSPRLSSQHASVSMLMWHQPQCTGTPPSPRAAHGAVVVGERLFVFGGNDGAELFNDLHILDTTTWCWSKPAVRGQIPSPRAGHTMNLLNQRHIIVFGGGTAQGPVNDMYVLDAFDSNPNGLMWTKPKLVGTPPSPRAGHTSCAFFANQLLVFGGGYLNKVFNDLHLFNYDTLVWSRPADTGTVPTPRAGHTSNVLQSRIYVFAGGDAEHVYNDVHCLDTAFLRIQQAQQNALALQYQVQALEQQQAGGQAAHRPNNSISELSLSNLSLGPASNHSNTTKSTKSQSAPSSPMYRPSRTLSGNNSHAASGETKTLSNGSDGEGVSEGSSGSPAGDGTLNGSSSSSKNLSVSAVAKLLAAHTREREELDRDLLARVDGAVDRLQQFLSAAWTLVGEAEDPNEQKQQQSQDPLVAALASVVKKHRTAQVKRVQDSLAAAQNQVATELQGLRSYLSARRGDSQTYLQSYGQRQVGGTSVLQTLSRNNSNNVSTAPAAPPIQRSSSAETDGAQLSQRRPSSSRAKAQQPQQAGQQSVGVNGMLTVKSISVASSTPSSALQSPISVIPNAPGLPGPGTPIKMKRKRGKGYGKGKAGEGDPASNASSVCGTPVMKASQPGELPDDATSIPHHHHLSQPSTASTQSASTNEENSPLHRQPTPDTPSSVSSAVA